MDAITEVARMKWIDIQERLPYEEQECLVVNEEEYPISVSFHTCFTFSILGKYQSFMWKYLNEDNKWVNEDSFTHWMPLPELPE